MKLVSFSVENYRSITTARKIPLSDYSILVGANNEGKSNILHALALAMQSLSKWLESVRRTQDGRLVRISSGSTYSLRQIGYKWESDFPLSKQRRAKPDSCTKVVLEFELSSNELDEFKEEIKSSLNGTLPLLLTFGSNNFALSVQKPGRGHATLNKKSTRIAAFVASRIRFDYIPAIRTSDSATNIISHMVEAELRKVETNPDYRIALERIEEIQEPVFRELSDSILSTISGFLPAVKSVQIKPVRDERYRALRRQIEILVDDGNLTKLSRKGDGVQSLAAIALMRHAAEANADANGAIIAIEEPESHLHPRAVHELREVIEKTSESSQVVLTTHSPLFVRPGNLKNTIIVSNSTAKTADHVSQIRDALGVRFSDNLLNARLVAILEGSDDQISLAAILARKSKVISAAVKDGLLAFDNLGGASSLSQKASFYQASACDVVAFLDNDIAGRLAAEKAIAARSIKFSDVYLSSFPGRSQSELEDLYDINVYREQFRSAFGVDPKRKIEKGSKWSETIERQFVESGKLWSDALKADCKHWLAKFAASNPDTIIRSDTGMALTAFCEAIERKVSSF